jgi:transcription initiation factor TFIIH subunit 3
LEAELPLSKAIANILIFINAHIAFNNANQVAVIASHSLRAVWLYPRPSVQQSVDDISMNGTNARQPSRVDDANKYRPFALIERDILLSVQDLLASTTEDDISTTATTQMAGALTMALAYINKATLAYSDNVSARSQIDADAMGSGKELAQVGLQSRVLVVSVSGDLATQYIPLMNTTFAAQTMRVPIDIIKLAGDTVFLQQASDATKGIYMQIKEPRGLLQYLMTAFLPDQAARQSLIQPTQETVGFISPSPLFS